MRFSHRHNHAWNTIGAMATSNVDLKALARLAIWARFCCVPIRRRGRWTGFDADEWTRLLDLASAVGRKTVLRFLGIVVLLTLCSSIVGASLLIAAIVFFSSRLLSSSPFMTWVIPVIGAVGFIVTMAIFRVAADSAAHRSLIKVITVQGGDAELVAKVWRQSLWVMGAASAAIMLTMLALGMFRTSYQPFFEQWSWLFYLLTAVALADYVIRVLRGRSFDQPPRPVEDEELPLR
jgi:hypothetical protein